MAYDEKLAQRMRDMMGDGPMYAEKKIVWWSQFSNQRKYVCRN